jgi:MFS family permease
MKIIFQNKNLSILFISTFLFFSNEALFLPTLPLQLSANGYNNTMIGVILGAFALGVLLSRPISGYVTDKKGRKKALVFGVFIFAATPIFYLVSNNFIYLMFIRFIHGLGISFYTSAFPAYITDTADELKRAEALGHMSTSTTLAFTFGPLAGSMCFKTYGFTMLIFVCTIIGLINLCVILMISETIPKNLQKKRVLMSMEVFNRSVLVSSFICLIYAVIFGGIMTFLPLLLDNVANVDIGDFFLAESIMIVVCRIVAARFADIYGRGPVFFYSFLIILTAVFLISEIQTIVNLIIAAILFGIGSALCSPALSAFVADNSPPQARGTVFSFFYGAFDVGVIVAGMILGFIADIAGLRQMFMFTSIGGLISLLIFATVIKNTPKKSIAWALLPKRGV